MGVEEETFSEAWVERDEILLGLAERVQRLEQAVGDGIVEPATSMVPWTRQHHSQEEWEGLAAWVDMMVSVHTVTELSACWPGHEGRVCELDVLQRVWIEAAAARAIGDGSPLAAWYQYQWWPLRHRLREQRLCVGGHREEPASVATGRGVLAAWFEVSPEGLGGFPCEAGVAEAAEIESGVEAGGRSTGYAGA